MSKVIIVGGGAAGMAAGIAAAKSGYQVEIYEKNEKLGKKVYITIDLDILDPSIFPGTGTPEPGGITYRELETVFKAIKAADIELVGADMVELSPHYDTANVSTIVACKVLRELALLVASK